MTELFLKCIKIVLANEGGYANIKDDLGKETYRGISRLHFPNWEGWDIIDEVKLESEIKYNTIINDSYLNRMVYSLYYQYFWDDNFDLINDENVILHIFDFGVNAGKITAIKKAQRLVGVISDGIIGSVTANAINKDRLFLTRYIQERRNFYIALAKRKPSQNKFLHGWLNRIEKCKFE